MVYVARFSDGFSVSLCLRVMGVMTEFLEYGWGMNTKASHDPCVFVDCGVGR